MGTVIVGFSKVPFRVHRDLICYRSEYFRGAFEGGFAESAKGEVSLKQESVKYFALFLAWLYAGKILLPTMH